MGGELLEMFEMSRRLLIQSDDYSIKLKSPGFIICNYERVKLCRCQALVMQIGCIERRNMKKLLR